MRSTSITSSVAVPIVTVAGRELVVPFAAARRRVQRQHGATEQIVAAAHVRVDVRAGIADGPIQRVEIRIVAAGEPRWAAAVLPAIALPGFVSEFTRRGNRIEAPQPLARGRIVSLDESARAELAAGDAGNNLVLERERRGSNAVALTRIGDLRLPQKLPRACVQRHQCGVQRAHEQPVAQHRHAAIEAVDLALRNHLLLPLVPPDLQSGFGVEREHLPRHSRRVHHSIHHQRRPFEQPVAHRHGPPRLKLRATFAASIWFSPEKCRP